MRVIRCTKWSNIVSNCLLTLNFCSFRSSEHKNSSTINESTRHITSHLQTCNQTLTLTKPGGWGAHSGLCAWHIYVLTTFYHCNVFTKYILILIYCVGKTLYIRLAAVSSPRHLHLQPSGALLNLLFRSVC